MLGVSALTLGHSSLSRLKTTPYGFRFLGLGFLGFRVSGLLVSGRMSHFSFPQSGSPGSAALTKSNMESGDAPLLRLPTSQNPESMQGSHFSSQPLCAVASVWGGGGLHSHRLGLHTPQTSQCVT